MITVRDIARILRYSAPVVQQAGWHDELVVEGKVYSCRHSELVEQLEKRGSRERNR